MNKRGFSRGQTVAQLGFFAVGIGAFSFILLVLYGLFSDRNFVVAGFVYSYVFLSFATITVLMPVFFYRSSRLNNYERRSPMHRGLRRAALGALILASWYLLIYMFLYGLNPLRNDYFSELCLTVLPGSVSVEIDFSTILTTLCIDSNNPGTFAFTYPGKTLVSVILLLTASVLVIQGLIVGVRGYRKQLGRQLPPDTHEGA